MVFEALGEVFQREEVCGGADKEDPIGSAVGCDAVEVEGRVEGAGGVGVGCAGELGFVRTAQEGEDFGIRALAEGLNSAALLHDLRDHGVEAGDACEVGYADFWQAVE